MLHRRHCRQPPRAASSGRGRTQRPTQFGRASRGTRPRLRARLPTPGSGGTPRARARSCAGRASREGVADLAQRVRALGASLPANCSTPSSRLSTTNSTSPQTCALIAGIRSPDMIIHFARPEPIRRGARWVPPPPGIRPRRTSGNPSRASSVAIRRSHASASSQPAAQAEALDRRDHRHGAASIRFAVLWIAAARPPSPFDELSDVGAHRERTLTAAAQDDSRASPRPARPPHA